MLYGREPEGAVITGLLDGARRSRGGVLVVRGEAGIGKSALLEAARADAGDMRILSAQGVEAEAPLPFAGLHQLLRPALRGLGRLPAPQDGALRGALGLTAGGEEGPFLVSLAVLSLLAETAERRPLLCLVDDVHWIDDASADALVFVARRLEAEAIALLFAAREGEPRRFEAPGLPELRLGGLGPEEAGALLDRGDGGTLAPAVRTHILEAAAGNPLALVELPQGLSAAQRSGAEPLLAPLPVGTGVAREFLARVRRLPEDTQTLLLVAATEDTGALATVLRAAHGLGAPATSLDAAERAGLVEVRGPRLVFRHPLVRSAVYQGAPLSRRQAAHLALADALGGEADADRRVWHRAAAAVEPDARVAEELEQAAGRARRRNGFAAASLALERSAALSTEPADRARRLTGAAECAWFAGRLERALMLLERARPLAAEPLPRADVDRLLGLIEMTRGLPSDACRSLVRAAVEVAPFDGERALQLLNLASVAAAYAGDRTADVAVAGVVRGLGPGDTPSGRMLTPLLIGLGAHAAGDFAAATPQLRLALERAEGLDAEAALGQPLALLFAGRAALYLGEDEASFRAHHEAAARARAGGVLGVLAQILPRLTLAEISAGRWPSAAANAREGLELGREIGQPHLVAQQLVLLAVLAALQGDEEECRALAAEGRELASARGLGIVADVAHWALTLLELGLGRTEDGLRHARHITTRLAGFWAALDRIEAATRAGRPDLAGEWLDPFEAWAESTAAAWAGAVVLHCRALLSEGDAEAAQGFAAASDAFARAGRPFERARTELAVGEVLRRRRRRVEAREHLRAALDGFEALGARAWAERTRLELRASGQTARRQDPRARAELTPQERQVARFVAEGRHNREVAAHLFLSPRTVEFHLRNVFRKLGVTSRTELARIDLDASSDPPRRDDPVVPPV